MDKEEALSRIMQLLHEINEVITQQKRKVAQVPWQEVDKK